MLGRHDVHWPFTLLHVQLLLVQLQLLLWRLQIHLFVMCLLHLYFPQVLVWIHLILLLQFLVLCPVRLWRSICLSLTMRELFKSGVPLNLSLYLLLLYLHPMALSCLLTIESKKSCLSTLDHFTSVCSCLFTCYCSAAYPLEIRLLLCLNCLHCLLVPALGVGVLG